MASGIRLFATATMLAGALGGAAEAQKNVKTQPGNVCFTEGPCVKVDSDQNAERIVGVRDSSGKQVDKVGAGGDIIVFSPHAYARRDSEKSPYTIHRLDVKAKAVKTPYTRIVARVKRIGFHNWKGDGGSAVGMTSRPVEQSMLDGMIPVAGQMGGIGATGELAPVVTDARFVFEYGDYRIVAHSDNASYSIADANFRPLSPKLDNVVSFKSDFSDSGALGLSVKMIFAIPVTSGEAGSRVLYSLLPHDKGQTNPPGLIGLAPLLENGGISCGRSYDAKCREQLQGWIGVWANETGPLVSLEGPLMQQTSVERFKSVDWDDMVLSSVAVVENQQGGFGLRIYKPGRGGDFYLASPAEQYADRASAKAAVQAIRLDEARRIDAAYEAEKSVERNRNLALQAARDAEMARRAERAAAEDAENRQADALIASKDADKICAASWTLTTFYARTNLADACRTLRPAPAQVSRGFWGDMAAGLAAYNRAVQSGQISSGSVGSSGASSSGSYDNGDFARSMRSIDSNLRAISDPNWNGAAGAAQR